MVKPAALQLPVHAREGLHADQVEQHRACTNGRIDVTDTPLLLYWYQHLAMCIFVLPGPAIAFVLALSPPHYIYTCISLHVTTKQRHHELCGLEPLPMTEHW